MRMLGSRSRRDARPAVLFMQSQDYFGADSQIQASIARHLDRSRYRVIVACNPGPHGASQPLQRYSEIDGVDVFPMHFGPSLHARTRGEIARSLLGVVPFGIGMIRLAWRARRSGVAVVHGTEKPRDVLYGYVIARLAGAASITHLHVKVEDWIDAKARWVMHRNDALIGVSKFVADSAVAMGYDPARVHAVLNGLEPATWRGAVVPVDVHAEFGVPADVPVVAIIARIFPWKGHEQLIRAVATLRERDVECHLLVVGEDDPRATPGGGSYSAQLRTVVSELGLDHAVTFTGFRSDIPEIMAGIDLLAMPSHEEPFGMVYVEALAMGTPVVASRSGGVPEFIEHGVTGLLADPDDVADLARMLERLLVDPDERARLAAAGREMVWGFGTATRMADDVAAVYDLVTRRRS